MMAEDGEKPADAATAETSRSDSVPWRGWLVILGGFLVHLTLGTIYTVGNVTTYLASYIRVKQVDPTFTYEQATWIYTTNMMARGVFTTLGGYMEHRFGPRVAALVGCAFATTGVFTTAYSVDVSPWLLVFTHGVLFGIGTGIGYVGPITCSMRWFPGRKGLVTGIVVGGFGLGALIFTQVQTAVLNPENKSVDKDTGYFSDEEILNRVPFLFKLLGATYAVIQLFACAVLVDPPASNKEKQAGDVSVKDVELTNPGSEKSVTESSENETAVQDSSMTETEVEKPSPSNADCETPERKLELEKISKREMEERRRRKISDIDPSLRPFEVLRTKEFYMLWFTFFFNQQAIGYITTMYKAFGQTFIDDDRFLAIIGSISSVFNSLGRVFWGGLGDKTCYRTSMLLVTALLAVLFASLGLSEYGGRVMYAVWVVGIFSVFSGTFALLPTATCQTFGQRFSGPNYGLVFTSAIAGPPLQSLMAANLTGVIGPMALLFVTAGFAAISCVITFFYDKAPSPRKIRDRWIHRDAAKIFV